MTSFGITRCLLGAIITLSFIRVFSYAISAFPTLPDVMNSMEVPKSTDYDLDAEENTDLFAKQDAVFTCSSLKIPDMITHWLKDGTEVASIDPMSKDNMDRIENFNQLRAYLGIRRRPIQGSIPLNIDDINSNTTFTVLKDGRLYLRNITKSHAGRYSCVIEDHSGKILRRQFNVTVIDEPRCSVQPTTKQYLYRHSNTHLQCALNFKHDGARNWKKNGKDIIANGLSEKFNALENGALHVFELSPEDSGNYTCHVQTILGWISCGPVELNVLDEHIHPDKAEMYISPNVTVRPPHDTAEFECLVNINATYGWARRLPDLICSEWMCPVNRLGYSPRKNNLILKKVTAEDTGYYECKAQILDDGSLKNTAMYLDVQTKPEITVAKRSKIVLLAHKIVITCSVTLGNPPGKVYWMKDGERIDMQTGRGITESLRVNTAFLNIDSAENNHKGYYQCVASNDVGTVSSVTFLDLPEGQPPPTPQNVTAVAISPSQISVNWSYTNLSAIHSFKITTEIGNRQVQNEPMDKTTNHHVVSNLQAFTNYTVKLTAFSRKSPSETVALRVQTLEGKPCRRVERNTMHTINISPTTILLTWKSLPVKDRCGIITQYQVLCVIPDDSAEYHHNYSYVNNSLGPFERGIATEYKIFPSLRPGVYYLFSVVTLNSKGFGPESSLVGAETYKGSVKSCMKDGGTVFQYVKGKIKGQENIRVSWALFDDNSADTISVSLVAPDETVKVTKYRKLTASRVVLTSLDKYPIYIIRIKLFNIDEDVCETYNFTVSLKDKKARKKQTLPTIDSGSSLGPHCIKFGWKYKSTGPTTYIVRYKKFLGAHFQYFNTSHKNVKICKLQPWSEYEYGVAVLSRPMPKYNELDYAVSDTYIRTAQSKPGIPHSLQCYLEEGFVLVCAWSPPFISNGLIRNYTLRYRELGTRNVFESISTTTEISLKCPMAEASYILKVSATNDAGKSIPSISVQVTVPHYDMELNNCLGRMPYVYDEHSDVGKNNAKLNDVTLAIIIAGAILAVCLLVVLTLIVLCFPDYFRERLCRRKCLGLAGKNKNKNKPAPNGKIATQNGQKPHRKVPVEMLTEQNTLLLSDNNSPMNGKVSNGNGSNNVKKNGIHKTSFIHDKPPTQESRYENVAVKGGSIFKSKSQKTASTTEDSAANKEQSQHLILSVPIPKHCIVSSDTRSSVCTHSSMSIDSITEEG